MMSNVNKATAQISKIAALLFAVYPMLDYYGYGNFTLSFCLTVLLYMYTFVKLGKLPLDYPLPLISYFIYLYIARFVFSVSFGEALALSFLFVIILWGFLHRLLDFDFFIKVYRIAAFVNIFAFIIQAISYELLGYRFIFLLDFLPLTNVGAGDFDAADWNEKAMYGDRGSAFFSEPAHFVQYLVPLLIIELFYISNKKAYLRSIVYVLTLLLLSSGNALLALLVVALFFIFSILIKAKSVNKILYTFLFVFIAFISANYFLRTEKGQSLLERQDELDINNPKITSGFVRVFRGYYVWDSMTMTEKIFGLNSTRRIENTINKSPVFYMFKDELYFNGFQSIIIQTGLIGLLIISIYIFSLWHHNNLSGQCCLAVYISLSFIAAVYLSYTMLLYFVIAYHLKNKKYQYI